MAKRIERFEGISVPGWFGPRPGGGYAGKTDDLDKSVDRDAKWLAETFPKFKVQIRFNSDRESGGAWLVDGMGDTQLGISSDLVTRRDVEYRAKNAEFFTDEPEWKGVEGAIVHGVVADAHVLRDTTLAEDQGGAGREPYASPRFRTTAEARHWILMNVVPSRIKFKRSRSPRRE